MPDNIKHTPGPWATKRALGGEAQLVTYNEDGSDVSLGDFNICAVWEQIEVGVKEANAVLIAAAPDLGKALNDLREYVEHITYGLAPMSPDRATWLERHAAMNATLALQKAGLLKGADSAG